MSNDQVSTNQTQTSQTGIDCSNLTGIDAQACQSLQNAVATHHIDLSSAAGQYTAYQYHAAAFDALQRQQLLDESSN